MEDENKLLCLQKNMFNQELSIMKDFEVWKENRLEHLSEWIRRDQEVAVGLYKFDGNFYKYRHILPLDIKRYKLKSDKEYKIQAINDYNVLTNNVEIDYRLLAKNKIHRFVHHLNSSQMLCYNYFCLHTDFKSGILLLKQGFREYLNSALQINLSDSAQCRFEFDGDELSKKTYIDNNKKSQKEGTSFDFYIKDGKIEIFFEIKYTEEGFGKAKNDDEHKAKYKNLYIKLLNIQKSVPLDVEFERFRTNYQLFRNSMRVTDENKYVVIIYPQGNALCESEFKKFEQEFLTGELKDHVKRVYWEDLITKDSDPELFEKYFAE